ncbi:flavodoxin family protein [Thermodesulfobacterium sp. TA1]|uniref:flavodoxin family protein n=1 Tax=Thermodesulfobacterium sp. TA1 TaxID=2234087 RepID=UPI0012318E15|nr:flavodoxin family protein [Thermodesulfobacterium sp. TA1]QER42840.1 flavodoxin family protein [Thermodesulfobacterium sp. TA1]
MKVIAFNGSPRKKGNTQQALELLAEELLSQGIKTEIIQVGDKPIRGCLACYTCRKKQNERCAIEDEVNDWIQKMKKADGIVLASPVYFSGITGTMKCFLDRAFLVSGVNGNLFRHKVGAALAVCRRAGGVATYDQLLHYLTYAEMVVATSNYWNGVFGLTPGEVLQDEEGRQIVRVLAKNLAWLLKTTQGKRSKNLAPEKEIKTFTNFIR